MNRILRNAAGGLLNIREQLQCGDLLPFFLFFFFFFTAEHKVEPPWLRQSLPSLFWKPQNVRGCLNARRCGGGGRFPGCLNGSTRLRSLRTTSSNLFVRRRRRLQLVLSKQEADAAFLISAPPLASRRNINAGPGVIPSAFMQLDCRATPLCRHAFKPPPPTSPLEWNSNLKECLLLLRLQECFYFRICAHLMDADSRRIEKPALPEFKKNSLLFYDPNPSLSGCFWNTGWIFFIRLWQ